jgi:hypothetical protein
LPSLNLSGYIGDTYPLCKDLPPKAFLSKGAVYRFIGGAKVSNMQCVFVYVCSSTSPLILVPFLYLPAARIDARQA